MTEKKRRLFNGFDVAVVLLIALGAFLWFFVINNTPVVETETFAGDTAIYFIEVPEITPEQADAVQIGDNLLEGAQHIPIGRVVGIEISPFELRVECEETQTIRFDDVPTRVTMIISVETQVVETERDIFAEGQYSVKGGARIVFTGPGYAFGNAFVLGWERG